MVSCRSRPREGTGRCIGHRPSTPPFGRVALRITAKSEAPRPILSEIDGRVTVGQLPPIGLFEGGAVREDGRGAGTYRAHCCTTKVICSRYCGEIQPSLISGTPALRASLATGELIGLAASKSGRVYRKALPYCNGRRTRGGRGKVVCRLAFCDWGEVSQAEAAGLPFKRGSVTFMRLSTSGRAVYCAIEGPLPLFLATAVETIRERGPTRQGKKGNAVLRHLDSSSRETVEGRSVEGGLTVDNAVGFLYKDLYESIN